MSFRALLTTRQDDGTVASNVVDLEDDRLPDGAVTVDVEWADLNYKDGLCLTGGGGLVRTYPHVAGIDFAGTVRESADPRFQVGDPVVLTGWRLGETRWGGYAERARVDGDWLVPLSEGLSLRDAMVVGTAGLTAMLAIERLEAAGLAPGDEVLVTGAAGGVGTMAISLLSRMGYRAVALSGRHEQADRLRSLGASEVMARDEFLAQPDKPLESARWASAIDSVGGAVLGKLLRQVKYGGAVASVGNAGGVRLETNVLPFILRAVSLIGIDSVMQPFVARRAAWARIARTLDLTTYSPLIEEITLDGLSEAATRILAGHVAGRILVKVR